VVTGLQPGIEPGAADLYASTHHKPQHAACVSNVAQRLSALSSDGVHGKDSETTPGAGAWPWVPGSRPAEAHVPQCVDD